MKVMARSAAPMDYYRCGFTRSFNISTERSTREGVVQLLADFREDDPDCLGRPSYPHAKFAVSYGWESGSGLLLTKLQAAWLIDTLMCEQQPCGTRRVSLWFDKLLCAGGCPGNWVAYDDLDGYIFHDVICLVPPGDPSSFLGRGGRGWMILENVAGMCGGYVRLGGTGWMILENVAGMCGGYVRVCGNVAGNRNKFATREDRFCNAFQFLLGMFCEDEFENLHFSDPSDRVRLRAWASKPTRRPVIGASPNEGGWGGKAVGVGSPMQPGLFFSSVLNKVVETALPPLYPDGMITTVGAWTFGAVFVKTSQVVSVKVGSAGGKQVVVNRGTVRVAGSNFKVGTMSPPEAKSRYGGSSSESELFLAVQAASSAGFSSDFLHWVGDYEIEGEVCFYMELAKSPNCDQAEPLNLARLTDLFAGDKVRERRGKSLVMERCDSRSVEVQAFVYHMGGSVRDEDLQGVLRLVSTAEGQTAVDVGKSLVIVADTFYDVVKHSLTEDRLLLAALFAARTVELTDDDSSPGCDEQGSKIVPYRGGLAESGRYPVDTIVVGALLALGLAAVAIAAKNESVEAVFAVFGIVCGGLGMLATFVAVYHKCVHDGWPLSPAARGYMPVTDASEHAGVAETAILREAWKKGIARRIYCGANACYLGEAGGCRMGPGPLSLSTLVRLGCSTGVSKAGELRLKNPDGVLLEVKPVQGAVYHATEVPVETGFTPARVRVEVLMDDACIGQRPCCGRAGGGVL